MTTTNRGPVRRPQEQRRAATRAALIDATIACIRDEGYGAATTRHIAELAGVTIGALGYHFPTRVALIASALDEVGQRLRVDVEHRLGEVAADSENQLADSLDIAWDTIGGELFIVWVRVWLAAAEDPELHEALTSCEERLVTAIKPLLGRRIPDGISPRTWYRRMNLAFNTIRGLALWQRLEPRRNLESHRDRWPDTRKELLEILTRPEQS
ncbi:TetR/AcrR family transcriptional regulator [Nocardia sp. N2S4-5]|uniref:TetR/AcrR family transcriptional regulator n=1 Tax=Nocardia sp. N2S4-5 TaxID=3351565 RepID=UPI0037D743F0